MSAHYADRIPDVRSFPDPRRFAGAFVTQRTRHETLSIGSSLTFGYPFRPQDAYPAHLHARNLGIVGLSLNGVFDWVLCPLASAGTQADLIVIEIPLVNEMSWLPKQPVEAARIRNCTPGQADSLFALVARQPLGLHWFGTGNDWLTEAAVAGRVFPTPPDGYFATLTAYESVETLLRENLAETSRLASRISRNVIFFVSPIYTEGLPDRTITDVEAQIAKAHALCMGATEGRCVDASPLGADAKNFYNRTHLSAVGSAKLARLIRRGP